MAIREVTNFKGLKRAGVVTNHPSLDDKIKNQGFPPGFWAGPNTHVWFVDEVNDWLASRPAERPPNRFQHEGDEVLASQPQAYDEANRIADEMPVVSSTPPSTSCNATEREPTDAT
jgi:predicted DNA-binding transcriptional regulator AlpA